MECYFENTKINVSNLFRFSIASGMKMFYERGARRRKAGDALDCGAPSQSHCSHTDRCKAFKLLAIAAAHTNDAWENDSYIRPYTVSLTHDFFFFSSKLTQIGYKH